MKTHFYSSVLAAVAMIYSSAHAQVELGVQMTPRITATTGQVIEYSDTLGIGASWAVTTNNVSVVDGKIAFYDTNVSEVKERYYRCSTNRTGMVWIAPGSFTMGSPTGELGRQVDEGPVTEVTIDRGFWIGQHEVTQREFRAVTGFNPSWFTGDDNLPVETVSWSDATNYCAKLTERERASGWIVSGQEYRLPTEAQWEYVCRAGSSTRFNFGDDLQGQALGNNAWYLENCAETHSVGLKQPNSWGIYDLYGNVWEWCQDWYGAYAGGKAIDPTGPISGTDHIKRGGAWNSELENCRSASRSHAADVRQISTGLRVVLVSRDISAAGKLSVEMIPRLTLKGAAGHYVIERAEVINDVPGWAIVHIATVESNSVTTFYDTNTWQGGARYFRTSPMAIFTNLVYIVPGTFTMGSPSTETDRGSTSEGPQTQVTISKGFWMSKYETTQGEYQSVMGVNPSYFKGDNNLPVEQVSWDDANNYCANLTSRERAAGRLPAEYAYRLPTEAEWEYACRAGTTTRFSYGDDLDYTQLGKYAWWFDNSASKTHTVGGKQPNAWGLYDMHGNVCEWCLDWYGIYPSGSVTDPKGSNSGSYRMIRGGGWAYIGGGCRSAFRIFDQPGNGSNRLGFRPVLALGQ